MMKKKEKRARIHRNHAKSISFSQGSRARFNYTRRCWRKGRAKKKGEEGKKKRARSPRLVRCETRALTLASLFETLPHGRVVGNYLRPRVYRLRVIREDTTNGVSFELRQLRVAVYRFNGSLISVPCLYWPPLSASPLPLHDHELLVTRIELVKVKFIVFCHRVLSRIIYRG